MKIITNDEMLAIVQKAVDKAGSQTALATRLKMNGQNLSATLLGKVAVSKKLARSLGFRARREIVYTFEKL